MAVQDCYESNKGKTLNCSEEVSQFSNCVRNYQLNYVSVYHILYLFANKTYLEIGSDLDSIHVPYRNWAALSHISALYRKMITFQF